jgi:hypothetical protein
MHSDGVWEFRQWEINLSCRLQLTWCSMPAAQRKKEHCIDGGIVIEYFKSLIFTSNIQKPWPVDESAIRRDDKSELPSCLRKI